MTFVAFSDASFGCRADLASQGGFLLLMVNKNVAEGTEGYYNILDWRSWKVGEDCKIHFGGRITGRI